MTIDRRSWLLIRIKDQHDPYWIILDATMDEYLRATSTGTITAKIIARGDRRCIFDEAPGVSAELYATDTTVKFSTDVIGYAETFEPIEYQHEEL